MQMKSNIIIHLLLLLDPDTSTINHTRPMRIYCHKIALKVHIKTTINCDTVERLVTCLARNVLHVCKTFVVISSRPRRFQHFRSDDIFCSLCMFYQIQI